MNDLFYKLDTQFFLGKLRNQEHFKYSRFNDGELKCVANDSPNSSNCDGHIYFPEMATDLEQALIDYDPQDYYLECFKLWYDTIPYVSRVLHALKSMNSNLRFIDEDFIRISQERRFEEFKEILNTLKELNLCLVGPAYLLDLKGFEFDFIEVPLKNCYRDKNRILREIKVKSEKTDQVFLFSSSMATNVFIDAMKEDSSNTYIDWGSAWDTFFVSDKYKFIRKRSTSNKKAIICKYQEYLI